MLSRRVLVASRFLRLRATPQLRHPFPIVAQQFRCYAEKIVKVPEMAESISEGTLKQWSKQIGDFVEQDEEIATIETDKVRLRPPPFARSWTADFPRSMLQSMRLKQVLSRNSWQMKKTPLQLGKIWFVSSLAELLQEARRRRQARNPRNLLPKISLHLRI